MFEMLVIAVCLCVGYTLYSIIEWCYNEIKSYVGRAD